MKTTLCICLLALAIPVFAQVSSPATANSPAPAASISPAATSSPTDLADKIEKRIEQKFKKHHGNTTGQDASGPSESEGRSKGDSDDIPDKVLPIVAVSLFAVFGTPILIVAVILYFGFSKSRMQHRTIRMLVEKGQPVPAALLAPPTPAVRQRSDMRRGVVLTMVGLGLMVWLGAINDWEGGVWSFGLIPFLIGAGYLLVWKLEGGNKAKTDNPPPLP